MRRPMRVDPESWRNSGSSCDQERVDDHAAQGAGAPLRPAVTNRRSGSPSTRGIEPTLGLTISDRSRASARGVFHRARSLRELPITMPRSSPTCARERSPTRTRRVARASSRPASFRQRPPGRGIRRSEKNASRSNWAHVFQLLLAPSEPGLEPGHEQKRFSTAQRRGGLCVVASADARRGSLRIHQDALMCSALLEPGQHVVHELSPGRTAWLHVVEGEATLGDIVLTTGDGAGVTAERAVSLTAQSRAEILLLDLGEELSRSRRKRARNS